MRFRVCVCVCVCLALLHVLCFLQTHARLIDPRSTSRPTLDLDTHASRRCALGRARSWTRPRDPGLPPFSVITLLGGAELDIECMPTFRALVVWTHARLVDPTRFIDPR